MKRPLKFRILAALAAFCLIGILFFFYNAFNGNPVSAAVVTYRANAYVKEHWPEQNFSVNWARYDFKSNGYYCQVQSPDSQDTHFTVSCSLTGPIWDSYEYAVLEKNNTFNRLDQTLNQEVMALFAEQFPYRCQIAFCYFTEDVEKAEGDRARLTLDMPFQLQKLPYPASLTIYMEAEQGAPSWGELAEKLLLLKQFAENNAIEISNYTLFLERPYVEDENGNLINQSPEDSLGVYNFPSEEISGDDLAKRLMEFAENKEDSKKED